MFAVVITEKGGAQRREQFDQSEVTIGRVQGNDIILAKGNVSKRHSRIVLKDGRFIVVDLKSTNGTYVNGRKTTSPLVVKPGDKIYIGDFILMVEQGTELDLHHPSSIPDVGPSAPPPAPAKPSAVAASAPPPPPPRAPFEDEPSARELPSIPAPPPMAGPMAVETRPRERRAPAMPTEAGLGGGDDALRLVMAHVAAEFDVHVHHPGALQDQERWSAAQRIIQRVVEQLALDGSLGEADRDAVAVAALREAVGLGVLEALLADERVHEVVVNGPGAVMVDLGDGLEPAEATFSDATMLTTIARRLLAQGGRELDPSQPMHKVALPYGPHVTLLLPPVAISGPVLEIRRIQKGRTIDDLVRRGVLGAPMRDLLAKAVARRRRVVVTGPSSSGVTTVLGALAQLTEERERLVTAESIPDLALDRPGTVRLASSRMSEKITLGDVIHQASQLRSDRLVVDDVAGPELLEALTCLASRQAGDMVGVHAGPARDCLAPLRLLLSLGPVTSVEVQDRLLARAVDLVVEVARLEEGHRVVAIHEVQEGPDGKPSAAALFTYDGAFNPGGAPSFAAE
jgi:pilus assembly protein CpaF